VCCVTTQKRADVFSQCMYKFCRPGPLNQLNNYSTQQNSFRESNKLSNFQNVPYFIETEELFPCFKTPAISLFSEQKYSIPSPYVLFLEDQLYNLHYPTVCVLIFRVIRSFNFFPPNLCTRCSSASYRQTPHLKP